MPKWKMEAASAASAQPALKTSTKCSPLPAPPEAITGMETARATAAVSGQSKPMLRAVAVHGGEQDLARAAPLDLARPVQALSPVGVRPPAT